MKILFVNQRLNTDPRVQAILRTHGLDDVEIAHASTKFEPGMPAIYNRRGKNTLPFNNGFETFPGFAMPEYQPEFSKTWQEITDQRCQWLRQHKFDKPWIVCWSGGIDSTCILAAIIKNLAPADYQNITVACNQFSIWENPKFFQEHVVPNFKIISSEKLISKHFIDQPAYIFNGELADQLFGGSSGFFKMTAKGQQDYLDKDIFANTDYLFGDFLKNVIEEKTLTAWYCQKFLENIRSTQIPVQTFYDFFWWIHFNYYWTSVKLRQMLYGDWGTMTSAVPYLERFVHWFDSDDYQQWAMVNNLSNVKYGGAVEDYKVVAKSYIYEVDKNSYYFKYKTKTSSNNFCYILPTCWYCITDDFSLLNLTHHWDIIQDLLPQHLNFSY